VAIEPNRAIERVLVNGQADQQVSPSDRGTQFGDGLFETIAVRQGRPRFLTLHLERLELGCTRLGLTGCDLDEVRREVLTLAGDVDQAIIKVVLTRGTALARGYGVSGREKATRITFRSPWPTETGAESQKGIQVRTATLRLGENPALAGLKHCNRLEQILARREWMDPSIPEALMFSSSGRLVSGTMSNVFIVDNSGLRTPRIDLCGVAGVMRRVILRKAQVAGITVREDVLDATDLTNAAELFLTNARMGIWPVRSLDGRALRIGSVTRQLQALLQPLLEEPVDE
jgi:4-amino-4-deoxychorismate lyase